MYTITGSRPEPMTCSIKVDGKPLLMEVDTGATLSIISHDTMIKHWGDHPPVLQTSKDRLRTYTGEMIQIQGIAYVTAQDKNGKSRILPLAVISGTGPSLLGRNWLNEVPIDWPAVHFCKYNEPNSALTDVLDKHPVLFEDSQQVDDTGMAKIYVADTPAPRFWKARNLAYMMRDLVSNELDRLLAEDIIEPVQYSEWAAPIVPVMKADRTVRICGDYKLTVNQLAKLDRYPIPRIEDLYAQLGKGTYYTKLDMRYAYEQIALHPDCHKYVTINTHRGLFTYKRLPYGVLSRLEQAGFRLKKSECSFMASEVQYLGHKIDQEGIHAHGDTLKAVQDAPVPTIVSELRLYLGMVNHYGRFLHYMTS